MPFGAKTADADPAKALAVRQAIADLVDRQSHRGPGLQGHLHCRCTPTFPTASWAPTSRSRTSTATAGKPSLDKAKKVLADAGVTTPVSLNLQYNPDHYGTSSGDEYAMIKDQLEKSGLFKVNLQSTEWVTYSKASRADVYPLYQLGWFPDYSRRRQLPDAVLPGGQLPEEPLQQPDRQRPDQQAAHHRRQD